MNREIKFRVWDEDENSFRFFSLSNENLFWMSKNLLDFDKNVQQFTGLKDKNKKEIYEGDILDFDGDLYYVLWNKKSSAWGFNDGDLFDGIDVKSGIIKGNIFENPKSLKC